MTHVNPATIGYLADKFCDAFCTPQLRDDIRKYASFNGIGLLKIIPNDFSLQKSQMRATLEILITKGLKDLPLYLLPLGLLMKLRKVVLLCDHDELAEKINAFCRGGRCCPDEGYYVWGTGGRAKDLCCKVLTDFPGFLGYIDNDTSKHGTSFLGKRVHHPKVLQESQAKIVYVASTYYREIRQQISLMNPTILIRVVPSHI